LDQTPPAATPEKSSFGAGIIALAAWLVPGLGHLLLKRWERAGVLFFCVATLAAFGLAMRGQIYPPRGQDIFGFLGCIAELGAGAIYFLAHLFEHRGADLARVAGDFGTRFLAIAGLLNYLCALDAWHIARGGKP
jgi:hypothetical protein